MAEGNWQCGMCAAYNESSKHACMVCDTFRALGAPREAGTWRSGDGGSGDLLAAPLAEAPLLGSGGAEGVPGREDVPPVRVMEVPDAPPEPVTRLGLGLGPRSPGSRGGAERASPAREGAGHAAQSQWALPRLSPGTVRALALGALAVVVPAAVWLLSGTEGEEDRGVGPPTARECPSRVVDLLPRSGPGSLVESYETERHRIVLCTDGAGELFYFGEFLDGSEDAIVLAATRTEDGYTAVSGETRYEIARGEVVIIGAGGEELGRFGLVEADFAG